MTEEAKFFRLADELLDFESGLIEPSENEKSVFTFEACKQQLKEDFDQLKKVYHTVMDSSECTEKAKVREHYKVCQDSYITAMALLSEAHNQSSKDTQLSSTRVESNQVKATASEMSIPLPACDIAPFYGDFQSWPTFRDLFTALYKNNSSISNVQKFFFLIQKCRGEAKDLIKRTPVSNEGFPKAWARLEKKYENKRNLVNSELKILLSLKNINIESSKEIKYLQSELNNSRDALETYNIDVTSWDFFFVYLGSTKLPETSLALWEQSIQEKCELPKWDAFDKFLTDRIQTLDSVGELRSFQEQRRPVTKNFPNQQQPKSSGVNAYPAQFSKFKCHFCESARHTLGNCFKFRALKVDERYRMVKKYALCTNCFAFSHPANECRSNYTCSVCNEKHHTLLHGHNEEIIHNEETKLSQYTARDQYYNTEASTSSQAAANSGTHRVNSLFCANTRNVLLGTAQIIVKWGHLEVNARALIDSGSEATFISHRLQKLLKLPTDRVNAEVTGLNEACSGQVRKIARFSIRSPRDDSFDLKVTAMILPKLTGSLPSHPISSEVENYELGIPLADANWMKSEQIDVLIGGDLYPHILLEGIKKGVLGSLIAQQTVFGWILTGPISQSFTSLHSKVQAFHTEVDLTQALCRFWELEEVTSHSSPSEEVEICEDLYNRTTIRNAEGRYQVELPFKPQADISLLHNSKVKAKKLLLRNEVKLMKTPEVKIEYEKVLNEYISLNHMEKVETRTEAYYLPHHAVFKPESTSTKVRVVFNASSKTSSGFSLNDMLYTGPTLQADLMQLILEWRRFKYVFNGDIEKMYRQILVDRKHTPYQRILFRNSQLEDITEYELKTVTFGVNCAPYLAIRTLIRLASDVEETHPVASKILRDMMYVDDALVGEHDLAAAVTARDQLIDALKSAGFVMRKWTANYPELLEGLPTEDLLSESFLKFEDDSFAKTLGIRWNAKKDLFFFTVAPVQIQVSYSKREILSLIAKLFDPAGWLAPIIIRAKMLMQSIWLTGIHWDDQVPQGILTEWKEFIADSQHINEVNIPRWTGFAPNVRIQYHAFCDASEKAYGACIYIRVEVEDMISSKLICAKSRVAPVKTVSLPRLELCGATLLAELVASIKMISRDSSSLYCWTDSTIVLAWLQKPPCTWNVFVANRVTKILEKTNRNGWRHVISSDNPADLVSRGVRAKDLVENSLWWQGPCWLHLPRANWPEMLLPESNISLEKKTVKVHAISSEEREDILARFSGFSHAMRVMSFVFRWVDRHRKKSSPKSTELSQIEVLATQQRLIRCLQQKHFSEEWRNLKEGRVLATRSCLLSLNPFLDQDGILRVGSRLAHAQSLTTEEKYPIILPYECVFSKLLAKHIHVISLHGGERLMLRLVRTRFWIIRAKNLLRSIVRNCLKCVIFKKETQTQIMSALPKERVTFTRPFAVTGVDFCGPFDVKSYAGRGYKLSKGYVCLFVCFATKAVHLEVTTDLSTPTFMAAFSRFISRRGCPHKIFSDNGTNFAGASREIRRNFKSFMKSSKQAVEAHSGFQVVEWKFIPPGAPHMGGLWEAGVKSFKHHFKRMANSSKFTFEELTTLVYRIEACLNSRPISAASSNPDDLTPLTPGHFLIGTPLLAAVEPPIEDAHQSILNRWQKLKALAQEVSERWKREYLQELHKRYKWQRQRDNMNLGDLVVVKEDNLATNEWCTGRVVGVHPGKDGRVRVADVRTGRGIITRPITKLVLLPC